MRRNSVSSLYAQYIKEREGKETIETDKGFATYTYVPEGCYIQDIYVHPDHRKEHVCFNLADQIVEIAKEKGCKKLFGTVCPSANGSTTSLKVLLAYGFKLESSGNNLIVMVKEI
jgi:ribosomal protein S18 acetylase RimI-like enzyme